MKHWFYFSLLFVFIAGHSLQAQPQYRRGNPNPSNQAKLQFYIVDSDDNSPLAPSYQFVDTLFGANWTRITGFSNTDDGYATVGLGIDSIYFPYYNVDRMPVLPRATINTNGTITLNDTIGHPLNFSSPLNTKLPDASLVIPLIAPLWGDWEFRTTGDSTKVFVRPVTPDSMYVSFYNLALKGTNGKVRSTFQVVFSNHDSSVTYNYRSFDGSFNGIPAAQLIQARVTIGIQNNQGVLGATYLYNGTYFAKNANPAFAQDLHNGLAVKFLRRTLNAFRITSIDNPPNDRYELGTNSFNPQATIENLTDTNIMVYVKSTIVDAITGVAIYDRLDSTLVSHNSSKSFTGSLANGVPCGSYKLIMTIYYPGLIPDQWAEDNTMTRSFVYLTPQLTPPFYESFGSGLNVCNFSNMGASLLAQTTAFHDQTAPTGPSQNALILDRRDENNEMYPRSTIGGDTIISAPINLLGKTYAYLSFAYQRGLATDSSQAGIFLRTLSGPERQISSPAGFAQLGDTLFVEGLDSLGARWNPTAAHWNIIGTIPGGLDFESHFFRVALAPKFAHDHFRFRIRLQARNNESGLPPPSEDNDSYVIDNIEVSTPLAGQTDVTPLNVDLGNGIYTHVPRDLAAGIRPRVTIANNGFAQPLTLYTAHLYIHDQLGRPVYDREQPFLVPTAFGDSTIVFPSWNLHGSQGGIFTAWVVIKDDYLDSYHGNDSDVFFKTMFIDDSYALDDGAPDNVGSVSTPASNFIYEFTPLSDDSLRGASFYFKASAGVTSWNLTVTQDTTTIASRSFPIAALSTGFATGSFPAIPLTTGTTYRLHFVMNSGSNLGGDASKSLVFLNYSNGNNSTYTALHPEVLSHFYDMNAVSYNVLIPNASQGGPLLPMMRLVFSGAQNFLPLEFLGMQATRGTAGVLIRWQTANESKVDRYEVLRKGNSGLGKRMEIVGKNLLSHAHYALLDETAPSSKLNYELLEHDRNGTIRTLATATVDAVQDQSRGVFPNPVSNILFYNPQIKVTAIYDGLGRTVRTLDAATGSIDVSGLGNGLYFLAGDLNRESIRIPFTVMR